MNLWLSLYVYNIYICEYMYIKQRRHYIVLLILFIWGFIGKKD